MSLKTPEIKERIAQELTPKLTGEGFVYKKGNNEYKWIDGNFTFIFRIELVSWSDHYSINVQLEISQSQIEHIEKTILGKRRQNVTIGADVGRVKLSPDGRKIVNGGLGIILSFEGDVDAAIESLLDYYKTIAKPYFIKYNSLLALDDIINNEPFEHCPAHVGGMFYERCIKGLIVAKLIRNPRYDELERIYNVAIKETFNESFITDYHNVREYLRTNYH